MKENYANLASCIGNIGNYIDKGLSLSELYESAKMGFSNMPNPANYGYPATIIKSILESMKSDMDGIVLEGDKRMMDTMASIASTFNLTDENQLANKIVEGCNALLILENLKNYINGNIPVQVTNTSELVEYLNHMLTTNASIHSGAFMDINAIVQENAMLKYKLSMLEQK